MTVVETGNQNDMIKFPISAERASKKDIQSKYLNHHEQQEIHEFQTIYYLCENSKKQNPTKKEMLINNGYDDDEGYYRIQTNDHVQYRYQLMEIIGKGAFGQVIKALDHKTKELVAIKLVKNQKKYYY